ncbi:MAG: tryptophan synthase subunit alpha [Gemmatimonadaceae bacterium]
MSVTTSSDAIARRFELLKGEGRRALVTYVTAGHPDRDRSVALMQGLEDAGADVLEVGVPFSDPLADGPVIQASSQIALGHGVGYDDVLDMVTQARLTIPVVLFSYLNPVMAAGADALNRAASAGVSGVLITDLPVGADPERERWLGESPLAFVRLVAPTTPEDRMREIARHGRGFVYLISRLGVTGMQNNISSDLPETIGRLRRATALPICVGFGVSTAAHAREVGLLADGIVVGSALVKAAESGVDVAVALAGELRRALDER